MSRARRWLLALACATGGLVGAPAKAAQAQPVADDTVLEARVDALAGHLRCLVCQNQSLADSHAALALDLKNQVREQVRAGGSEAQAIGYMTQRYGDFVLYKPPVQPTVCSGYRSGPLLRAPGRARTGGRVRTCEHK